MKQTDNLCMDFHMVLDLAGNPFQKQTINLSTMCDWCIVLFLFLFSNGRGKENTLEKINM